MTKTLYQILNVSEYASTLELHQAYKRLEHELSGLNSDEAINRLNSARAALLKLCDPDKRIAYDQKLASSRLTPDVLTSRPPNILYLWLQNPTALLAVVAICALLVYWNIENKRIEQAENSRQAEQAANLYNAKQQAIQAEFDRKIQLKSAEQQAELERERVEMEHNLHRQENENQQTIAGQQLDYQAQQSEREQDLKIKQSNMDLSRQEQELAEKKMDLQSQKSALAMQSKQQAQQNAAMSEQRALQQHDANIQSIRDLQAAKLRDYDRNHYGSGEISIFNVDINK